MRSLRIWNVPRQLLASVVATSLLLAGGCASDDPKTPLTASDRQIETGLEISSQDARPGDTVVVGVAASSASPLPLSALQGTIRFDPARLRYLGQIAKPNWSI